MQGQKLASPHEVVAPTAARTRLRGAWYGGTTSEREVVTGTGHGYRLGDALGDVRWVSVHDGPGTHRDAYCLTTDSTRKPPQMGECYPQRGAMETTVQEGRDSRPLESTPGYGPPTGLRLPPCWCGLYTMVVRLSRQLPRPARTLRPIVWRDKSTVPLSAMLTGVRRAFWGPGCCHTPAASQECSTLSPS